MIRFISLLTVVFALFAAPAIARPAAQSSLSCDNSGRCVMAAGHVDYSAHLVGQKTRHKQARVYRAPVDANGSPAGMVRTTTAAGIEIVVAPDFAAPIQGLVSDLLANGIKPKQIHCYATHGHVRGSNHYTGHACDFDFYRACMGCSARWTRHVHALIAARGLRDGCSFGDCGHVDSGDTRHADRRVVWPRAVQSASGS